MAETVRKLDSRRRAIFPDCFAPGDVFLEEQVDENRVVFRLIVKDTTQVAELESSNGCLMINQPMDHEKIRQAIRADRNCR